MIASFKECCNRNQGDFEENLGDSAKLYHHPCRSHQYLDLSQNNRKRGGDNYFTFLKYNNVLNLVYYKPSFCQFRMRNHDGANSCEFETYLKRITCANRQCYGEFCAMHRTPQSLPCSQTLSMELDKAQTNTSYTIVYKDIPDIAIQAFKQERLIAFSG